MKAISFVLVAIAATVALSGCANLRARTAPAKACLTNPCGGFGPCQPCGMPPPPPQYIPQNEK